MVLTVGAQKIYMDKFAFCISVVLQNEGLKKKQ